MIVLGQQLLLIEQGLQALVKFPLKDLGQISDQLLEIGQLTSRPLQILLAGQQLSLGGLQLKSGLPQSAPEPILQWLRLWLWTLQFGRNRHWRGSWPGKVINHQLARVGGESIIPTLDGIR